MNTEINITLANSVKTDEIMTDGSFDYNTVIDLRCCEQGNRRPIEETVLKRLSNHFINYQQMQMDMNEVGPCEEIHLCESLKEIQGNTLVVTDDIPQVAHLCNIYEIPFSSRVFYVVETGKGDVIKPYQPKSEEAKTTSARFATFN